MISDGEEDQMPDLPASDSDSPEDSIKTSRVNLPSSTIQHLVTPNRSNPLIRDKGRLSVSQEDLDHIERLLPLIGESVSASVAIHSQPIARRVFLDEIQGDTLEYLRSQKKVFLTTYGENDRGPLSELLGYRMVSHGNSYPNSKCHQLAVDFYDQSLDLADRMLSNQNLRENQPSSSDSSSLQRDDSPAEGNSS